MTDQTDNQPAHSLHGASAFARLMACPGSWAKAKALHDAGVEKASSFYAAEGTAAHWLAEQVMTGKVAAGEDATRLVADNGVEITEEICEAVAVYLEETRGIVGSLPAGGSWLVESRVNIDFVLESVMDPQEAKTLGVALFGTCDFLAWNPTKARLYVRDYKHGQGVPVPVVDKNDRPNIQLCYYALGALGQLYAQGIKPPKNTIVDMGIVQPRAGGEPVRRIHISLPDLLAVGYAIANTVKQTLRPDAPLNPGDHCRFCPALTGCEAIHQRAQELAQLEFGEMATTHDKPALAKWVAPRLSSEKLSEILDATEYLRAWITAVQAEASRRLDLGETVPGYKLVEKRAMRKWMGDDADVIDRLVHNGSLTYSEVMAEKARSPAQIEKLLKKRGIDPAVLDELVVRESSGTTLVPDHDTREDRSGERNPADEFTKVEG